MQLDFNTDVREWTDMAFLCKRISALVQAGWSPLGARFDSCDIVIKLLSPDNRVTKLDLADVTTAFKDLVGAEFDYWWRCRTRAMKFRKPPSEAVVVQGVPATDENIDQMVRLYREKVRTRKTIEPPASYRTMSRAAFEKMTKNRNGVIIAPAHSAGDSAE